MTARDVAMNSALPSPQPARKPTMPPMESDDPANAAERDPSVRDAVAGAPNVEITEGRNGEGFYEAVVRSLAEAR